MLAIGIELLKSANELFSSAQQSATAESQRFILLIGCGAAVLLVGFRMLRKLLGRLPPDPDFCSGDGPVTEAERNGVTVASREAIEAMLRGAKVEEIDLAARRQNAVDTLARLRTRLARSCPDALGLVDLGDFRGAGEALRKSREAIPKSLNGEGARRDAQIYAEAAALDLVKLDYRGAAENYGAAAALVARFCDDLASGQQEWRLRMEQARALVGDATYNSNDESLTTAIETYDHALSLVPRQQAPHAWAATQFHRGDALVASGVNGAEASKVEEAIDSYHAALEEWTPRSSPFEWARAQHNLGDALQRLADLESGVERLRPAEDAYRAALKEWTRETAPDLWAMAQGNLGDVLAKTAASTGDSGKLREAIAAYQSALAELRREIAPREWTQLQNSLGLALEALAEQESREEDYGHGPLKLAVEAFQSALDGQSAEHEPAQFAATSVSLGDSLLALGEYERTQNRNYGRELLTRAADAYRGALVVREELEPIDVAKLQINLAYALGLLWSCDGGDDLLDEALLLVDEAIALIGETEERQHVCDAEQARASIVEALGRRAA
ncbi:hypothetical protein Msil_0270 [Methylocella silvestris BL2]|uniref:Tetratricopeptide domain protein n=1 Tax=Methylocella silvestris (strain DSM 15510 / CIP 108128 / LMG 27833 / NCIMB 13906 / BL2) TaxID=395965 RepID=B8EP11_METSB|nr:hypothetical protein [Methylocella silvestris]ACK49249.1 hypothetical protein Msil_0270 [Methylocella silvestris BL2]